MENVREEGYRNSNAAATGGADEDRRSRIN